MLLNMNVQEIVQQAVIPVYGVIGKAFELQTVSIGKSFRKVDHTNEQLLTSVTLGFLSEYTRGKPVVVNLHSYNNHDEETRRNTLHMLQQPPLPQLSMDARTLRLFRFNEGQLRQLGKPDVITMNETIAEQYFSTEIHHWPLASQPSWFSLVNTDRLLLGETLGLSKDEVMMLFQQCIVINDHLDIINQYQQELDQYLQSVIASDTSL